MLYPPSKSSAHGSPRCAFPYGCSNICFESYPVPTANIKISVTSPYHTAFPVWNSLWSGPQWLLHHFCLCVTSGTLQSYLPAAGRSRRCAAAQPALAILKHWKGQLRVELRERSAKQIWQPHGKQLSHPREVRCCCPLTDDDERVVDVGAAEAVGGFADVRPRVFALHLLDFQPLLEDAEPRPAAVDSPSILHPHGEGRGVPFHRAQELDGPAQPHGLAVNHFIGDPGGA